MGHRQEALHFLKLGFPLEREQIIPAPGASVIIAFGNGCNLFCCIKRAQQRKARFLNQSFILTGRGNEKVVDGTPDSDLFVREHAGDDDRVSEERASTWTQDTMPLLQDLLATRQMIHRINADHRRKRLILKRETLTGIALLKVKEHVRD